MLAADARAGDAQLLALEIDKIHPLGHAVRDRLAIDHEADLDALAHAASAIACTARPSRTRAKWRFTAASAWRSPGGSSSAASAASALGRRRSRSPLSSSAEAALASTGLVP